MASPVDPNDVMMTGENSFVRLSPDGGKSMTDRFSHWRVLWCPAGAGHALFAQSTLTDGQVRIWSDNIAVARWLQRSIETLLFPAFADTTLPVAAAEFSRAGDPRAVATEDGVAQSLIAVHKAMGGGWQTGRLRPVVDDATQATMGERSDWKELLQAPLPPPATEFLPPLETDLP